MDTAAMLENSIPVAIWLSVILSSIVSVRPDHSHTRTTDLGDIGTRLQETMLSKGGSSTAYSVLLDLSALFPKLQQSGY